MSRLNRLEIASTNKHTHTHTYTFGWYVKLNKKKLRNNRKIIINSKPFRFRRILLFILRPYKVIVFTLYVLLPFWTYHIVLVSVRSSTGQQQWVHIIRYPKKIIFFFSNFVRRVFFFIFGYRLIFQRDKGSTFAATKQQKVDGQCVEIWNICRI